MQQGPAHTTAEFLKDPPHHNPAQQNDRKKNKKKQNGKKPAGSSDASSSRVAVPLRHAPLITDTHTEAEQLQVPGIQEPPRTASSWFVPRRTGGAQGPWRMRHCQ